ncbi:MAG TPA: BatD family protein [Tahibacter sp.]|uniref:BatD family protein n=1 Tax=Tahibacter sp. TaxID=2056211 RepID=UPI002B77C1EF|nr:BatD family protein [Tahibacter sp.]HSX59326.1 BatD family protein [Tahibacter sp.]
MMRRIATLFALAFLSTFAVTAGAAAARAWLDRDTMQLGETVTLNVETEESASEPDLGALEADFELLSRSSSSSVSIVNGRTSSTLLWAVGLRPKREGKLTIPALVVGSAKTQPIVLTVGAAPAIASASPGDDIFLDVSVDPQLAYVQQQIRVTVKFFYAINLTDGAVEELTLGDAVVQKLGQDRSYDAERSGRRYRVMERRYALTAQKSGPLQIPALNFRGRALSGNDPNALFFGRGRTVATRSEPIAVEIRPKPADAGSGPWLPAQTLTLQVDGATPALQGRVGEPLTLTVSAVAQGLGFEQLPELELPAIDGAEVYPDKSLTRSRENAGWVVGERTRKFAIVPKRAGTLRVPAMSLGWWDTANDKPTIAQTAEITIEVAEAAGGTPAAASPDAVAADAPVPAVSGSTAAFWKIAALSSGGLWVVTLALLWLQRRPRRAAAPAAPAFSPTKRSFEQAVAAGDAGAAAQRLLAWARSEGLSVSHLGELAARLDSPAQREAIAHLQAALYSGRTPALPAGLAAAFAAGFARASRRAANDENSVLPPLWGGR